MPLTKEQVLKQYFGYDKFRPLQSDIIDWVLYGQDALVLMPTGGGKSICFQVPAMVMSGITIVISPLIALMQDQVRGLLANGIPAAYINSSQTGSEISLIEKRCKSGELKLLYISPEKLFSPGYFDFIKSLNVSMFAIDESHCVSVWGHDFRPEYTQLGILKKSFPDVPVIALTATADRVTRKDILNQLAIPEARVFVSSFDRPNLSLAVLPGRNRIKIMQDFIQKRANQPGIIYCLSRKNTEDVASALQKVGIRAKFYHAKMNPEDRAKVQDDFIKDNYQVIVATIAFGMGIDKSNVRWVIHYSLPSNVESFYQEIGRAGRDGLRSDTLLFYTFNDLKMRQEMLDQSGLPEEMKETQLAKLERMKQYSEAEICRRRILLSYFNEETTEDCGNCDVCRNPPVRFDATILAQKALSAIVRTNENIAMGILIDILRGSRNRKVVEHQYHEIKTFGAGKDLKFEEWADYLQQMLNSGIMDIAYDEGHSYKLNNRSRAILKEGQKVELVRFEPYDVKKARKEEEYPLERSKKEIIRDALFDRLKFLRKQIADEADIPAFVVFSDATLSDMAQKRPINKIQMLAVSGVGEQKYLQYGERFMNEILNFARENSGTGSRIANGMTYVETFDLYKKGLSPSEIARTRGMNEITIYSHLAKLYEDGERINLEEYVHTTELKKIIRQAEIMNIRKGEPLKPLFEALNGQHEYHKLRMALAIWERNK
ncbi:ATP-dependent DNA helicase RecQ [Pseudarcicella hirudinis]|uniref:DNA helicase RecQ n=2 Tax=Pseudarcicella hirudinis TaxID=1079859 RepID=A0A1I5QEM1_9BACT|nr:DNA helicase RecQ [Pseudarcicella hirudinis]SFP44296.1 ATP-dependent DNA helicase RecQ [Pseudarcicella hirudinis]